MSSPYDVPPPRTDLLAWGTVRAALGLTFFGGLLFFLSAGLLAVIVMVYPVQLRGVPLLILVAANLGLIGVLSGLVLIFAGVSMTTAAPRGSGTRTWGRLAAVCGFLFLLLGVVLGLAEFDAFARDTPKRTDGLTMPDPLKPAEQPPFSDTELNSLALLAAAALGVGIICHLLSLRSAAAHFGRRGVALAVMTYLLGVVATAAGLAVLIYRQLQQPEPPNAEEVETTVKMALGGQLLLGLWGLLTTALVRGSITQGLLHPE